MFVNFMFVVLLESLQTLDLFIFVINLINFFFSDSQKHPIFLTQKYLAAGLHQFFLIKGRCIYSTLFELTKFVYVFGGRAFFSLFRVRALFFLSLGGLLKSEIECILKVGD